MTADSLDIETADNIAARGIRFKQSRRGLYRFSRYTVAGERGAWLVKHNNQRAVGTATTLDEARVLIVIDERTQHEAAERERPQRQRDEFIHTLRSEIRRAAADAVRLTGKVRDGIEFTRIDARDIEAAAATVYIMQGTLDGLRDGTLSISDVRTIATRSILRGARYEFTGLGVITQAQAAAYAWIVEFLDGGIGAVTPIEDGPISPEAFTK